jgi:hypothetical protein
MTAPKHTLPSDDLKERLQSSWFDSVGLRHEPSERDRAALARIEALEGEKAELQLCYDAAYARGEALEAQLVEARKALEPFAKVAEQDIGADEDDTDCWSPMRSPYNRAPRIRVGDMRCAAAALPKDPSTGSGS